MADKEKVMWSLARCSCGVPDACSDCHYDSYPPRICVQHLTSDALALLKAQKPHIITKKDFENNPSVDENGYLPAYCEKKDRPIGWMAIHKGYIGARKDIRYWTVKPTVEQREAVEWE